jgi:hypothetical protein
MTDQISFPPLLDLSLSELDAHKQHLVSEIAQHPERRRLSLSGLPLLRLRFAVPAVAAICASVIAVIFTGALGGADHPNQSVGGRSSIGSGGAGDLLVPLPTLAHPLGIPPLAKQTTLSDAAAALGTPIVLPNTSFIQPSDAGPVWMDNLHDKEGNPVVTNVAVTFPAQGVIVGYTRPAPSDGSAAHFQAMANSMPSPSGASEGRVITLSGGVPALAVQQNSDDTGHNFGSVIFNMAGSEVRVMGHNDEATLESLAQSILRQSGASK